MTPSIDPVQFPRQIWQAVSEQARRCLLRRDFCPDQSRVENLRCVHLQNESEGRYGQQVWFFEATGIDTVGRRHMLYGAIELSIQYGLLEPSQTALFEDIEQRQKFLRQEVLIAESTAWKSRSTNFWVRTTCLAVIVVSAMWLTMLALYISQWPFAASAS